MNTDYLKSLSIKEFNALLESKAIVAQGKKENIKACLTLLNQINYEINQGIKN